MLKARHLGALAHHFSSECVEYAYSKAFFPVDSDKQKSFARKHILVALRLYPKALSAPFT